MSRGDPERKPGYWQLGRMRQAVDSLSKRLKPHALVRVIVPSHDRFGRSLTSLQSLRRFVEEGLAKLAGGVTSLSGEGIYHNGHPQSIRERVIVVESYLPARITPGQRRAFRSLIEDLAARAEQEALAVVVDGRLFLVRSPVQADFRLTFSPSGHEEES